MAGFGSLVPGMAPMPIPQMKNNGLQAQGMSILKAALAQQAKGAPPAGVPGPAVGESAGPGMPMQVSPPAMPAVGAPGAPGGAPPMGMLGALLAKLRPPMSPASGAIDPNTGMPVTPDVLAGAADMGGPGPGMNALSGMW